jgi:PhoH-like ATPase
MAKKTYVIDTSAYLTDANAIYSYGNNDIVVPLKVLEEIDNHKKRQDSVGVQARHIIRIFDALREKGNLNAGVRLQKGKGVVSVKGCDESLIPCDLEVSRADHIIIATALTEQAVDQTRKVIVVTRDINMRVICDSLGLSCEDYIPKQLVKSGESIYSGFSEILVDEQIVDRFYDGEKIVLEEDLSKGLYANQMIMMISNANEKKTALARFDAPHHPLKTLEHNRGGVWGIKPRNKEQVYALELLMDPSIPVVSLIGKAGSGKTLCAIAAGLEQILNAKATEQPEDQKKERSYKRLIVSRPVQPLGKDIGFLPGTMEEKMAPWLMPIQDNLQYLMGDNKATLEMYMEKGYIEIEALTYIRGRSISNAFIIIDEAQNLTAHEIKTILTRVGEGTKIVFTGDIEQIDNVYVDSTTNGLTYAVELLKEYDLTGHITLKRGERSNVATLAAKIL